MTQPPFETRELRAKLVEYLDLQVVDPITGLNRRLGSYKFGVYAFFDFDQEPIYVGQTAEGLSSRIGRHLTNQRTDAVAMKVLDPFEVFEVEVWPLAQYEGRSTADPEARAHLSWLEFSVFEGCLNRSTFHAVLNEKDPPARAAGNFQSPQGVRGCIVSAAVQELRSHPDTRIARRAETLSLLAKVISERQVQVGLRRTLLTQAKRLAWLADRRLAQYAGIPNDAEDPEKA
jgi:hypothetical protein